jgi:thiol-disulfide isomerase/thioredoxin
MKRILLSLTCLIALATSAQAQIVAQAQAEPKATSSAASADVAQLNAVVGQALQFLGKAENYVLTVQSQWKASGDAPGQEGQSNYRLLARGKQHRIEVQSLGAQSPQLVCVNDGKHVTTLLPGQKLYSQHAVGSPRASLESNQMLAQSLAGSAIDILLQPNVGEYVHAQATAVKYLGEVQLGKQKCHQFQLQWAGAEVELWFAAAGDPLLVQFVRTAAVPTSDTECYEMVHTARFQWKLNTQLPAGTFALELPPEARRVNDIYDALSGDDPAARIGQPLPKIKLSQLDGTTIDVAAPEGKRGLVLIFWATWCTPSVEQMPAVSEFVKAGASQGFTFYAVNVGEEPGDVRRFTAKSPLTSAIALDPKGQASSALRVTELPAAVVVGPDNTVRAILAGTAKEVQTGVAKELQALLTESATAPKTARRPGDSPAAPK